MHKSQSPNQRQTHSAASRENDFAFSLKRQLDISSLKKKLKRTADFFRDHLKQLKQHTNRFFNALFGKSKRYFHFNRAFLQNMNLRLKLILILTSLVLIVVTTLSTFILQYGQRMLLTRLNELCTVTIKSLSKSISGDLLLENIAPVSEMVFRTQKQDITGLKSIRVLDRNGRIVVSAPLQIQVDSVLQVSNYSAIDDLKQLNMLETDDFYAYYNPIFHGDINEEVRIGTVEFLFSKYQVLRPIVHMKRYIVLVTILIILISIIAIYFISQKMLLQIQQLSHGAKQVGRGNLNVRIVANSKDELGRLCHEFNSMVLGLREKMQMQKFVSKATVRMIKEHGNGTELPRRSEKRSVSVLFSDIRKFSLISERYPPEAVVELINIYLDLQARIIEQNLGMVDKFVGDEVMGVFEGPEHELNALRAAVGMQKAIRELNVKRNREKKVVLEVGIGLNSGDAVLGNMGSQDRMDYTVVGSMVNLCSHLCAKAKPHQIIATQNFIDKINGIFPVKKIEPIAIKGRYRPVKVFEIDYSLEEKI